MTSKQLKLLDFITDFVSENRYSPSYREMMDHVGVKSTNSIHQMIRRLEEQGLVTIEFSKARSVLPVNKG